MKSGGDKQVAKDVWASILEHIEAVSHPIYETVNPPASENEITQLENALNVQLPDAFRRYLSVWNGQHELVPFIGCNSFLPIPDMIETWSMLSDMFEDEDEMDWVREDRIKPLIWSRKWIPFTEFESSSHLILDLDPGVNGSIGQVFKFHSGMSYEEVIAQSFEEFSLEILKRLETNRFTVDDDVIAFDDLYFV